MEPRALKVKLDLLEVENKGASVSLESVSIKGLRLGTVLKARRIRVVDLMEVWWVALAYMSSVLPGSARTIHMFVAISSQPLMTVFARPVIPFLMFKNFYQ